MPFAVFGPGSLYVTRTDLTNQTPINIGFVNEFSYDESGEVKQLYGQNQYPLSAARGTIKATGKMKAAQLSGLALNAVFHGLTFSTGQLLGSLSETHVIATNTATVTNTATFDTDLGVIYAAGANAGLPFVKVTSGPTVGQYSVSAAGVYTFAAADQTAQTALGSVPLVAMTYAYTLPSSGQTKIVTNQPIGYAPTFQIDYITSLNGAPYYVRFYQCIASKLTSQFKLTDFMMPEIDFDFFANAAGQVYKVSYPSVS
jgi:hypothetical protein